MRASDSKNQTFNISEKVEGLLLQDLAKVSAQWLESKEEPVIAKDGHRVELLERTQDRVGLGIAKALPGYIDGGVVCC